MEGNLRFKIDWANLIVGSKFTVVCFVLLCICGQFSTYKPLGSLYLEGRFNGGFSRYRFGGLIFGGAYFRNFTLCHVICYHKEHAVCWAKNSLHKVTCIIINANLWK